jgi:exodeoxyribonuclease V beta subunit
MSAPRTPLRALPFDALKVPLDPGITLVEASAGTGKTFAITRLVLRLLLERKVESLSRILVVTFTEKATQELVTRIRKTLRIAEQVWSPKPPASDPTLEDLFELRETHGDAGREIVLRALGSLDDLAVSTIHGFCHRMLAESALESGIPFRTTFVEDDTEAFGRAANDWARRRLLGSVEDAKLVVASGESMESWIKPLVRPFRRQPHTRIDYESTSQEQSILKDFVESVDKRFEDEKTKRHLLGFDDLLRKLSDVLMAEGAQGPLAKRIRSRFGAALIDEFQDTDQTQFPIFSNAFEGCPLFLIGDPKQSIFRFRGADIHAYLRAAKAATRKYTLLENYRSTPAYVKAVDALFTRASDPFVVPESAIGFPKVKAALNPQPPGGLAADGRTAMEWWWVDKSLGKTQKLVAKDLALKLVIRDIANEIVRLRGEGLPCKSVAVLVRANSEARSVKAALDKAHIPAVIGADADVLGSEEADELVRLAAAIAAPHDGWAVRSAMATRLWGSDASEIAATLRADGEVKWMAIADRFASARDLWRWRGVAAALGELLAERESAERLLALPDGERRLTNVRHVIELLHEAWVTDGIAPEGFSAWFAGERTVANTPERRELRLETDSEAVQVLTIHKAKGLQFDVVFCPSLWQAYGTRDGPLGVTAVLADDEGGAVLDLGNAQKPARAEIAKREDAAENLRLAYVALTRAVHRCYVAWGDIGSAKSAAADSALGYLLREPGDEDKRAVLDALVASSGGTMRVRELKADEVAHIAPPSGAIVATPEALPLQLAKGQLDTWAVNSFSGLTSGTHNEESKDLVDPVIVPVAQGPRSKATGFRGFPAGTQAGTALHDILERLDFRASAEPGTRAMVERALAVHGLSGSAAIAPQRVDDVVQMLRTVCTSPIPDAGFALDRIPSQAGLREWRFDLSVATTSTRRIADALAAHGSAHARSYAPLLRSLKDSVVGGYLVGSVDLAFEHDSRWWLVDWKSNQLGETDADYAPDALGAAMMNAHYTLQYHIYLLALHRHLKARQKDYDPAKHWGGVAYVFLRGVTGASDGGWFRDEPTPALLDALDAAVGRRT